MRRFSAVFHTIGVPELPFGDFPSFALTENTTIPIGSVGIAVCGEGSDSCKAYSNVPVFPEWSLKTCLAQENIPSLHSSLGQALKFEALTRVRNERSRKSRVSDVVGGRIDHQTAFTAASVILPPSALQSKNYPPTTPRLFAYERIVTETTTRLMRSK